MHDVKQKRQIIAVCRFSLLMIMTLCRLLLQFTDEFRNCRILAVAEEVFIEMFAGKCSLYQFRVKILQDIRQWTECLCTDVIENLLVALFRYGAFFRIAAAERLAE